MLHKTNRPTDWGQREKHDLYGLWNWHKTRNRYGMVPEWADDFWEFVRAVGERPSKNHKLRRHDPKVAIGPNNFFWDEKYALGSAVEMTLAQRAEYMREYRKRRPRNVRSTVLKKHYGIDLEQWEAIYAAQGGVCAICKTCERDKNGRYANLAVDHCHTTGVVRGLLCNSCNRAIGLLKDSPSTARAAALYLERTLSSV